MNATNPTQTREQAFYEGFKSPDDPAAPPGVIRIPNDVKRLRGVLLICAESMRISMRNGGQTDWTHLIAGIEDALAATEPGA
jgi:hypothetical protein